LVMVLQTVKINNMVVIYPVMIMMVVTVKVAVVQQVAAVKIVMTANMILPLMDPSAVIQPGMSMGLTVLTWKPIIAGIALVVAVQVMVTQCVVMDHVMVMKLMKHAQMIVMLLANVMLVI